MKQLPIVICLLLGLYSLAPAQTPIQGIINDYTPVQGFSCDSTTLFVGHTTGFAPGDQVLIIQMQGATVSLLNDITFGSITNLGSVGNYEFNRIRRIGNNLIGLQFRLKRPYDVAGKVQLVRVPEYTRVTTFNLTCKPWDGTTGGILALDVTGKLTLQGDLDVSRNGFRGGQVADADISVYHETNYFYPVDPIFAGAKGEGIALIPVEQSYGRGRSATGGGGGNAHNAGGGGGGNGGAGGNGGLEYYTIPGTPTPNTNGLGGTNVFATEFQRVVMGGGGGAGHSNDERGVSGGNGGGIIFLKADTILPNGFKMLGNGGDVLSPGEDRNDGQGGGGAGGSVVLKTTWTLGVFNSELKGGKGGDCHWLNPDQIIGPGGGGGGGKSIQSQPLNTHVIYPAGGPNGTANLNGTNGAQPGNFGAVSVSPLLWPVDNIEAPPILEQFFCPGDTINGQVYTEAAELVEVFQASNGCDSVVYSDLIPRNEISIDQTLNLCPGVSVLLGGQLHTAPDTFTVLLPSANGCDTLAHYNLVLSLQPTRAQSISLCPGEGVLIGGQTYSQSGTVVDTIPGAIGCDTIVTYTLILQPQPTRAQSLSLCPGESVLINGQAYTAPGVVTANIPGTVGCDTIVTYTLQSATPAPSAVFIQCPANISLIADAGTIPLSVNYALPTASSDCICPGLALELTAGLAPGAPFPNGATQICYAATDSCGQSAACCFTVNIREIQACDVKVIGCVRYELLSVTADAAKKQTYSIRVTNNCPNKLIYTAIQLPDAVPAIAPAHLSIFTTEDGNNYEVRNPNYSPFYSIRFKSTDDSIANGQSDIFKYTLPAQSDPDYIHLTSRLEPQIFLEAYLNTFYCPVGVTRPENRDAENLAEQGALSVYPNPATASITVDLSRWAAKALQCRIMDSRGQQLWLQKELGDNTMLQVDLPKLWPNGLYFVEVTAENGKRAVEAFVLQQ